MSCPAVDSTLTNNSTLKYFIEYDGYLTNHLAHGIIALHRLGVPDERIERFIQWYTPKLEPPTYDKEDERSVGELKGERVAFYSILQHYESLLKTKYKSIDELVKNEYPKVSTGMSGSALHGTIHLGYGYAVNSEKIILEGLAYTFHSYRPIVTSRSTEELAAFGNGNSEITDALAALESNKDDLIRQVADGVKEDRWKPLKLGKFQLSVTYLLADHGDMLTDLVLALKLGSELRHSDGTLDPIKLCRRAVYWSVTVYACAVARNEFFLLHGVTCAWALYQIIPLLGKDDGIRAVREFLTVLLAVYVSEGASALSTPCLEGSSANLDWEDLLKKTVDVDRDEHCYKLVQVCHDMVKDAEEHGEDPKLYLHAARTAIDYDLSFYKLP